MRRRHGRDARRGDRLYVSYGHGGAVILDIGNMNRPRLISSIDTSPPYVWPTHTVVPVDPKIAGRRWMLVADEHVSPLDKELSSQMPSFLWGMNITEETRPVPLGSFQVPELVGQRNRLMTGCHQPIGTIDTTEAAAAWFASGLRVIDVANPHAPRPVAYYLPDPPPGAERPRSNDVFVDARG